MSLFLLAFYAAFINSLSIALALDRKSLKKVCFSFVLLMFYAMNAITFIFSFHREQQNKPLNEVIFNHAKWNCNAFIFFLINEPETNWKLSPVAQ